MIGTSAIVAILQGESERRQFLEAMEAGDSLRMSTATFVELCIGVELRHGAAGLRDLDRFIAQAGIELVPVDSRQGYAARQAFRFGKGRHRAALNYGDCFSLALAWALGEPAPRRAARTRKAPRSSAIWPGATVQANVICSRGWRIFLIAPDLHTH